MAEREGDRETSRPTETQDRTGRDGMGHGRTMQDRTDKTDRARQGSVRQVHAYREIAPH